MSTIECIGVNLVILFDLSVRHVEKVKNHWSSRTAPYAFGVRGKRSSVAK